MSVLPVVPWSLADRLSGENPEWINVYVPAEAERQGFACLVQLSHGKQVSFSWPV